MVKQMLNDFLPFFITTNNNRDIAQRHTGFLQLFNVCRNSYQRLLLPFWAVLFIRQEFYLDKAVTAAPRLLLHVRVCLSRNRVTCLGADNFGRRNKQRIIKLDDLLCTSEVTA